jgi:hypothetical protein
MRNTTSHRATTFAAELAALRFENVFNPYADACPDHDGCHAADIRRRNLELVLSAALERGIDSLWIARDLGYRGGRRTGLALTDEPHLARHAALLGTPPLARATKGPAVGERTATVVWGMLHAIRRPIFLWNVFPLHPHMSGDAMSNRCHTHSERTACRPLLIWLLKSLRPRSVVAIGRDAHRALEDLGVSAVAVRHPSYGGQSEFVRSLAALYRLPESA